MDRFTALDMTDSVAQHPPAHSGPGGQAGAASDEGQLGRGLASSPQN